jgi:hypothetical protein
MKLVGFIGNDINASQFEALGASVEKYESVSGNLIFKPYNAYIQFDSYDENRYRPYLQLDAEICGGNGFKIDDIDGFVYREDDKLNRSVRYDFTDEELSILVKKGLYQVDFQVPELFTDTDFEIPMIMDLVVVKTSEHRIVYADYDMVSDFITNSEISGYDLVQYFADQQVDLDLAKSKEVEFENETGFGYNFDDFGRQFDDNSLEESTDVEHEEPNVDEVSDETVDVETQSEDLKPKVYEHEVDKLPTLNIDSILERHNSNLNVEDNQSDVEEPKKAPSEPEIINSEIRTMFNAADEFDSAKANTQNMLNGLEEHNYENGYDHGMGD